MADEPRNQKGRDKVILYDGPATGVHRPQAFDHLMNFFGRGTNLSHGNPYYDNGCDPMHSFGYHVSAFGVDIVYEKGRIDSHSGNERVLIYIPLNNTNLEKAKEAHKAFRSERARYKRHIKHSRSWIDLKLQLFKVEWVKDLHIANL